MIDGGDIKANLKFDDFDFQLLIRKQGVYLIVYNPRDSTMQYSPNFLSEGVRCGLDKEKERMGHTIAYFPFALWIERSQMAPYHKKLKFAGAVGDDY